MAVRVVKSACIMSFMKIKMCIINTALIFCLGIQIMILIFIFLEMWLGICLIVWLHFIDFLHKLGLGKYKNAF